MRILVCGSREWTDADAIEQALRAHETGDDILIHGGARGADSIAGEVGKRLDMQVRVERVAPDEWRLLGKRAGVLRNQRMLDKWKPDLVLAFSVGDTPGTKDMIQRSHKAGVRVLHTSRPSQESPSP